MSSDFTKLIQSLKQDIQTVSGDDVLPEKLEIDCVQPNLVTISTASTTHSVKDAFEKIDWRHHPIVKLFVKKFLLTFEFFLFFVLLLSVLRPRWLYKSERRVHRNQTVIVPVFSYLYLCVYSLIFTGIIHLLIYIQQRVLRTVNR